MGDEKKPRRRIKKVQGHGGHHGGSWKVAYADLVTALMALFMVLWLVSQADTKLKQAIANYFKAPGAFNTLQGGILEGPKKVSKEPTPLTSKDEEQMLYSTAALLQKVFLNRPEFTQYKDQVKISITEEGLEIQFIDKAERVSFNSGSAQLNEDAHAVIAEIAKGICELPNPIQIGGHTDRKPFPGDSYTNWELSADRANAARRVLQETCVTPESIDRIVGYADKMPLYPDDPFAPGNRRITIVLKRIFEQTKGKKEAKNAAEEFKDFSLTPHNAEEGSKEEPTSKPDKIKEEVPKPEHGKEGTISVGEPDKIPDNIKRTKEQSEH
jgi:chemotaxis protein MotB